jgi:uncharacterized phage protein (predicted DNA packaging)
MALALDIATVKAQLRLDPDDTEDDLIQRYISAATAHVEQHCDRTIVQAPADDSEMALTDDVWQAILLLVGHWYANREAVVVGVANSQLQLGVERLLWYRKRF